MNNYIAVTIGDINGVGIKILLKVFRKNKNQKFILFTNLKILKKYLEKNNVKIKLNKIKNNKTKINFEENNLNIFTFNCISEEDNTLKSIDHAYDFCKREICIGMITLPLRKDKIKENINKGFIGHTEYLQFLDKKKYSNMILYHKKIIISPITTHIQLKKVSKIVTNRNFLYNQILNLHSVLRKDFNINKPKIVISGLNPHSGENGTLGKEEIKQINPIIKKIRKKGIFLDGALSADSILINKNLKKYDCFVFMYHDQALIPFKYISQFSGVNYTGNLSIIRASPDHGTAYDLVKSNLILDESFINCVKFIYRVYKNRKINDTT
tara:strand:- start:8790 stop:9764 length:975 start_codon:yes stop_codon:yes gene_type:complete